MCKVSVIIPVYNVEKYLPACLDSVLGQSLADIEVIAIDDASPDGSAKILAEYAARDARVKIITLRENHMQGYGRNRGLEKAGGEYVYFLDSDDMIRPEALEELYLAAKKDDLDGIAFDSESVFETEALKKRNLSYLAMRKGNYPDRVITGSELFDLFMTQDEWLVYVQRQFWRREFLIGNEVFNIEGIEHEDEFFTFKAFLLAQRMKYLRKPYFIRRYRENSVMTRPGLPKDFHGYFLTYCEMIKFMEERDICSFGSSTHAMHMYVCMMSYLEIFEVMADPKDWFTPAQQDMYRLYRSIRKHQEVIKEKEIEFWKDLDEYKEIWIYGAGRIASSTARRLLETNHRIAGFVVTDKAGNPDSMYGRSVTEFRNMAAIAPDSVVLVAMAKGLHDEVAAALREKGFDYFLYANNELRGPFRTARHS